MKALVGKYYPALIVSAVLSVIATACGLIPFYVVYEIARAGTSDTGLDVATVLWWAGIAFAGILAKVVLTGVSNSVSHRAAYNFVHDVRTALVAKLDRVPLGFFAGRSLGDLKKVINEDAEQMEEALAHAVPDIAAGLAVPSSVALALAFVDWRLALAALVMFPIVVVVYPIALAATKSELAEYQAAMVNLRQAVVEYLQGMKVIRTFLGAETIPARFEAAVDRMAKALLNMSNAALLPGALLTVGLRINILVLLPVGGLLMLSGAIDLETFVLFLLMGLGVTASAQKLLMATGTFAMRISTAGKRIGEVLNANELKEPETPQTPQKFDVAFRNVSFSYEGKANLKDISFVTAPGELTAIVGPSGAGKSTIARLLCRFWEVDEGAIEIGGVDVRKMGSAAVVANMAIILQDTWLLNGTVRENIRIARSDATDAQVEKAATLARVSAFAEEMPHGLDSAVGEGGRLLSGGQRQRVAIARAILRDAPIVVMDEATSALDAENEAEVLGALAALAKGRTVIAIAHRLNTIERADQIVFVADGEVVDKGRHQELLGRCPGYAALYSRFQQSEGWRLERGKDVASTNAGLLAELTAKPSAISTIGEERLLLQPVPKAARGLSLFFHLLGPMRRKMTRQALPLLLIEGLFMGAPVIATILALLDTFAGTLTAEKIWLYTGFIAFCFFMQGLVDIIAHRVLWRVQTTAAPAIQRTIGQHLRRVPLGLLLRRDTGALEALITQHVSELDFVAPTARMARAVVAPLISLAVMFLLDVRLALAAVATIPLFIAVVLISDRIYRGVWQDLLTAREALNARLFDGLQGLPTLRSLGIGTGSLPVLSEAMARHRSASLGTIARVTPTVSVGLTILDLSFCALLVIGGLLVATGSLALPTLLFFLVVGLVFYGPIADAFELAADRRLQERTMTRISEVLDLPVLPDPKVPKVPANLDITFRKVRFAYDDRDALKDVSLSLPAGKLHAFVGRSGSGKSTALAILARFWDVADGAITIGGIDLRDIAAEHRARLFAIVFQETFLFNDTVANNLRVARPGVTDEEMIAAAKAACCHDVIVGLENGYETTVGEGGARLSGGERQRIAIARAILKDAPIVLLDEATASIDPDTEAEIRTALSALCTGKTVVVVAHRLSSVTAADQIVVFDEGRVVGTGTHDALLEECAPYKGLWAAHLHGASSAAPVNEARQADHTVVGPVPVA